MVINLDIG